jgi:hypothetical protein
MHTPRFVPNHWPHWIVRIMHIFLHDVNAYQSHQNYYYYEFSQMSRWYRNFVPHGSLFKHAKKFKDSDCSTSHWIFILRRYYRAYFHIIAHFHLLFSYHWFHLFSIYILVLLHILANYLFAYYLVTLIDAISGNFVFHYFHELLILVIYFLIIFATSFYHTTRLPATTPLVTHASHARQMSCTYTIWRIYHDLHYFIVPL